MPVQHLSDDTRKPNIEIKDDDDLSDNFQLSPHDDVE